MPVSTINDRRKLKLSLQVKSFLGSTTGVEESTPYETNH